MGRDSLRQLLSHQRSQSQHRADLCPNLSEKPPPTGPRPRSRQAQPSPARSAKPSSISQALANCEIHELSWAFCLCHWRAVVCSCCVTMVTAIWGTGSCLTGQRVADLCVPKRSEITCLNSSSPVTRHLSYWGKKKKKKIPQRPEVIAKEERPLSAVEEASICLVTSA